MNKSNNPNIMILMVAIKQLGSLIDEVVFVGGCATGLLITDLAAPPVRMTKDVDVIIQISTRSEYRSFTKLYQGTSCQMNRAKIVYQSLWSE